MKMNLLDLVTADRFNDPIYFSNWPDAAQQPILEENGDLTSIAVAGFNWATASYPEQHGVICETKALSQMGSHECEFNFFHSDVIFGTFSYNPGNKNQRRVSNVFSEVLVKHYLQKPLSVISTASSYGSVRHFFQCLISKLPNSKMLIIQLSFESSAMILTEIPVKIIISARSNTKMAI